MTKLDQLIQDLEDKRFQIQTIETAWKQLNWLEKLIDQLKTIRKEVQLGQAKIS